jgi:hypothetical protein
MEYSMGYNFATHAVCTLLLIQHPLSVLRNISYYDISSILLGSPFKWLLMCPAPDELDLSPCMVDSAVGVLMCVLTDVSHFGYKRLLNALIVILIVNVLLGQSQFKLI